MLHCRSVWSDGALCGRHRTVCGLKTFTQSSQHDEGIITRETHLHIGLESGCEVVVPIGRRGVLALGLNK